MIRVPRFKRSPGWMQLSSFQYRSRAGRRQSTPATAGNPRRNPDRSPGGRAIGTDDRAAAITEPGICMRSGFATAPWRTARASAMLPRSKLSALTAGAARLRSTGSSTPGCAQTGGWRSTTRTWTARAASGLPAGTCAHRHAETVNSDGCAISMAAFRLWVPAGYLTVFLRRRNGYPEETSPWPPRGGG